MSNDQKLADAILAMAKLSTGERATVMSVVERMRIATAEVCEPVGKNPCASMNRRPYSHGNRLAFADAAYHWEEYSPEQQKAAVAALATRLGRTEKAIRLQIQERIRLHIQQAGK